MNPLLIENGSLEALERSVKELDDLKRALDESTIVAITDQRGIINYVNDAFCRISKYSREELVGQDHRIINSGFHSKDFIRELWTTIASGKVWKGEFHNRAKDGSFYWVDTTIVPFLNSDGKPYQYVAIRHDITNRKMAEEKVRQQAALLDQAQDAILVRDLDDRIFYWNKSAELLYGWTREEVIGRDAKELLYRELPAGFEEADRAVRESGEWSGELQQVTKEGREIVVLSRWTLVRDDHGQPHQKLIVNTDVTEQKRLENEVQRSAQLSFVGELAAGLAHEIKNPLAGIQGAVDILIRRREKTDPEREALEGMRHEVTRIDSTVRALLDRARPRLVSVKSLSLSDVVRRAVNLSRGQLGHSMSRRGHVTISYEPPDDPIVINIDAAQIEDAVLNLIINAIDATEGTGEVKVRVSIDQETADREDAVIEVSDNGRGISEEDQARIFNPFFTTRSEGTGLGLPAVRRIARAHGGTVGVQSKLGQGSTFKIRLPLNRE